MTIIVTGAAGFIGSNIVKALNDRGETDIIAVDNLTRPEKFKNLVDCEIAHYMDKSEFLFALRDDAFGPVRAILHQGACSDTMGADGRYMMENNYQYSLEILEWCFDAGVPFIYASSASVYGGGSVFRESREFEAPLNVYGYSKFLFDQVVRRRWEERTAQVAGFRYFNVYGPRENHKARMASVAFHQFHQYREHGKVKLFEGTAGYGNGQQSRDFVFIEDVVNVNLHFLDNPQAEGIFNVGTGRAQPFNDVAVATVNACRRLEGKAPLTLEQLLEQGLLEYIAFPEALRGKYQSFTQADISLLREAGYDKPLHGVEEGVSKYVDWLAKYA